MEGIVRATRQYENWMARYATLVEADIRRKHDAMADDAFAFLRATYYRWLQRWPDVCPELAKAKEVIAVGDLHVENFGTWRDEEARLVWGVNDFDEAHPAAYAIDLVRLVASAFLAAKAGHLRLARERVCESVLSGYLEGLNAGGAPFVLEERHGWLRRLATGSLRNPEHFWDKLAACPPAQASRPIRELLEGALPEAGLPARVVARVAGVGSLGHQRYVAIAMWQGARIAREAKARVPAAAEWVDRRGAGKGSDYYRAIMRRAVRTQDPMVVVRKRWLLRRLAPHCSRVELAELPKQRDEARLLQAMGFETANVHLGSGKAIKGVQRDLDRRSRGWLHEAAEAMLGAISGDWEDWKKAHRT
jgi:Uncharacterized protein conserved in bacteria (DUF2252)